MKSGKFSSPTLCSKSKSKKSEFLFLAKNGWTFSYLWAVMENGRDEPWTRKNWLFLEVFVWTLTLGVWSWFENRDPDPNYQRVFPQNRPEGIYVDSTFFSFFHFLFYIFFFESQANRELCLLLTINHHLQMNSMWSKPYLSVLMPFCDRNCPIIYFNLQK